MKSYYKIAKRNFFFKSQLQQYFKAELHVNFIFKKKK